ncbi:MAG: DUF551 domain-containing protein [Plesiomonas shigelloides]
MEWVSVKDRLPDNCGHRMVMYLAVHAGWDFNARALYFDADHNVFTHGGGDEQKVTHWMPLPAPPIAE